MQTFVLCKSCVQLNNCQKQNNLHLPAHPVCWVEWDGMVQNSIQMCAIKLQFQSTTLDGAKEQTTTVAVGEIYYCCPFETIILLLFADLSVFAAAVQKQSSRVICPQLPTEADRPTWHDALWQKPICCSLSISRDLILISSPFRL